MLAIAAGRFDLPSETFIRDHVRNISPGQTVLLCREDFGATQFQCSVLTEIRGVVRGRGFHERMLNWLRYRWWRYVDPTLRGPDEARVRSFLKRYAVQAVLAEYGQNGALLRLACQRLGVPLYVHFHGFDATSLARDRNWRRHYRRLFRDAAGVIVPSRFLADRLRDLGCPDQKLHISPHGLDISEFSETAREPGRILAVGRLVEKKAPHLTIRAFSEALKVRPDCHLDIVGDGPLMELCNTEVERLGLQQSVTLHGALDSSFVKKLLSQAELFVQHSLTAHDGDMESFGVSLLEAMASSIPIIVTNHNGFSETIVDGSTGILIDEYDVTGMAQQMIALLNDRKRSIMMGRAGRKRVEANFTTEKTSARLREIMAIEPRSEDPKTTLHQSWD